MPSDWWSHLRDERQFPPEREWQTTSLGNSPGGGIVAEVVQARLERPAGWPLQPGLLPDALEDQLRRLAQDASAIAIDQQRFIGKTPRLLVRLIAIARKDADQI